METALSMEEAVAEQGSDARGPVLVCERPGELVAVDRGRVAFDQERQDRELESVCVQEIGHGVSEHVFGSKIWTPVDAQEPLSSPWHLVVTKVTKF